MQYTLRSQHIALAALLAAAALLAPTLMPRIASAATLNVVSSAVTSNNASSTLARVGDTLTFNVTLSGTPSGTGTPVINIANMGPAAMTGSGNTWTYATTTTNALSGGPLAYTVTFGGSAGEATTTLSLGGSGINVGIVRTGPTITVNGGNSISVNASNGTYADLGATARDAFGGATSVTTSGNVNLAVPGTYTITYTSTDAAGNTSVATRTVNVLANGSVGTSNDATIAALQAQLQSLLAQLATLTGNSTPSVNAVIHANVNASFKRNLSLGSIGADVQALQAWLNAHGYVIATAGSGSSGHESQRFGPATLKALIKYQKAKGITPATGFLGAKTRAALEAEAQ